jgi:hypothetical protein
VGAWAIRPGKPKHANRNRDRTNHSKRQSSFGGRFTIVVFFRSGIPLVIEDGIPNAAHHTNGNTDKGQAANTLAPSPCLLINNRESAKGEYVGGYAIRASSR